MSGLMQRFKGIFYLDLSFEEKMEKIRKIQENRTRALTFSRLKPVRKTKTKTKSSGGRKRVKDPIKEAIKLMQKLSPEQRNAIKKQLIGG